jgi:Phytanoyl-CoA dioxygenase (PhyH)
VGAVNAKGDGGSPELSGWLEDAERVSWGGDVYIHLHKGEASLTLQLSAVGTHRQMLSRTRFGDVSYNEALGLSEAAAAKVARAYAERLDHAGSALPERLPHLAVAAIAGRAPGSCRAAVAALWPRGMDVPEARREMRLDPAGLRDFLAPELVVDGAPFAGFVLQSIESAPADREPAECVLELEPAADEQTSGPVRIALGASWNERESFGAPQTISLTVRQGGTDRRDDLPPPVARLCSMLAALLELKQSPSFTALGPDSNPITASSHGPQRAKGAETARALPELDADIHRFAIFSSGYTVLRQVLPADEVREIAVGVERALQAMCAAAAAGREIAYTFYDKETYVGTRCIYCWGEACTRLIESDFVRRVAEAVIGPHKLFDMSAHRALPAAHFAPGRTEEWHRDIDVFDDSPPSVRYLWFFVPLDDFTVDNGATWIVPGSQRLPNSAVPPKGSSSKQFPTRVQLTGRIGDVFVINPSALHTVGHNATERARTMINLGVCHASIRPLLDHWAIAGPAIQTRASDRLRAMLGAAGEPPLDTTWSVLPEGWQTSPRSAAIDPSARVFPPEQQGYQRSHRIRDED